MAQFLDKNGLTYFWNKIKVRLAEKEDQIKTVNITLTSSSWTEGTDAFEQTVSVNGGTANSLIALQPTLAQMVDLQSDGVAVLVVDNNNGTFIAKAMGAAPSSDMTIQASVTEVTT